MLERHRLNRHIGGRIRAFREDQGMTLVQLFEKTRQHGAMRTRPQKVGARPLDRPYPGQDMLAKYERGVRYITAADLAILAKTLGKEIGEFFPEMELAREEETPNG